MTMTKAAGSQDFKARDAGSYDAVSADFDHFTERLTGPLAERVVELARVGPGDRVLDIGTGTGIVAFTAARRVPTIGGVDGIDLSDGMLAVARDKAATLGVCAKVRFHKMDAESLDFADVSFDVVVSLFALLHFPNPLDALKEMFRVIKPGGRVVIAVGSRPSLFSTTGLAHGLKLIPDMVKRLAGRQLVAPVFLDGLVERHLIHASGAEETHLASSSHDRTGGAEELVRNAGFVVSSTSWSGHQTVLQTADEFWRIQSTFSSIARKRIGDASEQEVASLQRDFFRRCEDVRARGGNLVYPFGAFFVVARRPARD